MGGIQKQVIEKEKQIKEEQVREKEADLMELRYLQNKNKQQELLEERKKAARYQSAHELLLEAKKNGRPEDRSAILPLVLGQKMTKAEYMINKDLLSKVAEIKKKGEFDNLHEFMRHNKITKIN